MKKNWIFLVLSHFTFVFGVNSQDYAFKVMANKGSNELKTGSAWQALKTGDKLGKDDELKVVENAYVALVHNSGKPLELKEAKTYKIAELAAKVGPGASVVSKYTDFILSSNSAEAKKNRLSATGSVTRGLGINIMLPKNQFGDIFENTVYVSWESPKTGGPFTVIVRDMFDVELIKFETPETKIVIDRNDPKLANQEALLVEVRSKTEKCEEPKLLKRLSATRNASIKKLLDDMGDDLKQETALNKFIMAGFYEENNLFIDAIGSYQQAIMLAPDVPTYQEAYEEFLLRNKLKKPASSQTN